MTPSATARTVRAAHGTELSCKGWVQEAALRMLMNNLDPAVAERPEDLVVYGGTGKAARNWDCFERIVSALRTLGSDETLLVQSGKPVGVFRTHADAPRVLIANSNLVPRWGTWEHFRELEAKGLMMYGQMTAGSWIYIGSQGIVQGTFETFAECADRHFGGTLAGRLVLTAGLGGMGGAQPLAVTMNGGVCLAVEVEAARAERRVASGYCDRVSHSLDEALAWCREAVAAKRPLSVGLVGNAAEVIPALLERGVIPDAATDQTSAHDPLVGYVPHVGLHPAIPALPQLRLTLQRSGAADGLEVVVHGWRPDGEAYDGLPGDLDAAAARRRERVVARRTILETPLAPPPTSAVSAWALDLRAV